MPRRAESLRAVTAFLTRIKPRALIFNCVAMAFFGVVAYEVLSGAGSESLGRAGVALVAAALCTLLGNLDQLETLKASATGIEARTRALIERAEVTLEQVSTLASVVARSLIALISSSNRMAGLSAEEKDETPPRHVDSIARAINVANAEPNHQGVATVNPIFTWVWLAQRIPVRVHIDEVLRGVVLVAGMTATLEIGDGARAAAR
jgi:hypothetical protein